MARGFQRDRGEGASKLAVPPTPDLSLVLEFAGREEGGAVPRLGLGQRRSELLLQTAPGSRDSARSGGCARGSIKPSPSGNKTAITLV